MQPLITPAKDRGALSPARVEMTDRMEIAPADIVERQTAEWRGLRAEVVTAKRQTPFDCRFKSPHHLLIAAERAEWDDGEVLLEGLPKSTRRSFSGSMTFVPAGHEFSGWQQPRELLRTSFFYIDPHSPLFDDQLRFPQIAFQPKLFFSDPELWRIAERLKEATQTGSERLPHYGEALGVLLGHELIRWHGGTSGQNGFARGGLSGRQRKLVTDFIEDHLDQDLRLSALAGLVDLSDYHFARAFKQSVGLPPHRYHIGRRIERAKALLAEPASSVTEVARKVGFADAGSFSAAFRKLTGVSPRDYRRSLD
jgi:AraC family transcriptional regulator